MQEKKKKKKKERKKEEDESMQGRKRVWECNKIQFFATVHSYRWLYTVVRG